ncbi:MAG: M48 family metalloprotease [Sphingomonadales bacterium]
MQRPIRIFMLFAAVMWTFIAMAERNQALAQVVLRDAEAEWFLRKLGSPFAEAAGMTPGAVGYYIIGENSLNAFVAAGQNMFINSGTINAADDVNELQGVMAHEMGHLSGAHQVRIGKEGAGPATAMALLSMLLGAAAIAVGAGQAGAGIIAGGQSMAQRTFFSYTRTMESSADQAAIRFLTETELSGRGILKFFNRIRGQELLSGRFQDPYLRTHPLTTQRLSRLKAQLEPSPYFNKPSSAENQYWFRRVKAKLYGFMNEPEVTLRKYPVADKSVFARYARVYAYNKAIEWEKAIAEATSLTEEFPDDPYFAEILGQIYLENGRVKEALPHYRRANELAPNTPLIMTALGHTILAIEDSTDHDQEAIDLLEKAVLIDRFNRFAWRQLGELYYRNGREPESNLATAELFALTGQMGRAVRLARTAMKGLPKGSPKWLRAQDIAFYASSVMGKDAKKRDGKRDGKKRKKGGKRRQQLEINN